MNTWHVLASSKAVNLSLQSLFGVVSAYLYQDDHVYDMHAIVLQQKYGFKKV